MSPSDMFSYLPPAWLYSYLPQLLCWYMSKLTQEGISRLGKEQDIGGAVITNISLFVALIHSSLPLSLSHSAPSPHSTHPWPYLQLPFGDGLLMLSPFGEVFLKCLLVVCSMCARNHFKTSKLCFIVVDLFIHQLNHGQDWMPFCIPFSAHTIVIEICSMTIATMKSLVLSVKIPQTTFWKSTILSPKQLLSMQGRKLPSNRIHIL